MGLAMTLNDTCVLTSPHLASQYRCVRNGLGLRREISYKQISNKVERMRYLLIFHKIYFKKKKKSIAPNSSGEIYVYPTPAVCVMNTNTAVLQEKRHLFHLRIVWMNQNYLKFKYDTEID